MQITLTHNSELRLHKVDALHRLYGVNYPIQGDNHYPSIGEECEVAKHGTAYDKRRDTIALARITQELADFHTTGGHRELTHIVNTLEGQGTLF